MANTTLDMAIDALSRNAFKKDILAAKIKTLVYYVHELIINHFKSRSPNVAYGYRPNTAAYEEWKLKHFGTLPQLVLSGRLRDAVLAGKVQKNGKIAFDLPEYGLYQLEARRDFLSPNAKDLKKLQAVFKRELEAIRKERINKGRKK